MRVWDAVVLGILQPMNVAPRDVCIACPAPREPNLGIRIALVPPRGLRRQKDAKPTREAAARAVSCLLYGRSQEQSG